MIDLSLEINDIFVSDKKNNSESELEKETEERTSSYAFRHVKAGKILDKNIHDMDNDGFESYVVCQSIMSTIIEKLNLLNNKKEVKVHKCEICHKVFKMNWIKVRHMLTHKPKSSYTCEI